MPRVSARGISGAARLRYEPEGKICANFVCSGSASKKTTYTRRAVPMQVAERLAADSYATIMISEADVLRV